MRASLAAAGRGASVTFRGCRSIPARGDGGLEVIGHGCALPLHSSGAGTPVLSSLGSNMSEGFFAEKRPAAGVKHAILGEYLSVFVGKTGRQSEDGRVAYVDGFAGPGVYDDEAPGSPLVAANVGRLLSGSRDLRGFFVEEKRTHAQALREALKADGRDDWQVWNRRAEEALPAILDQVGSDPLLVFLDPHGLAVPFDMLVDQIMARSETTEALLYFTQTGIARLAGLLAPEWWRETQRDRAAVALARGEAELRRLEAARERGLQRLDDFLGGAWWRHHVEEARVSWKEDVRDEYIRRVIDAAGPGWQHYLTPVPDRWEGPARYELILFTRHNHGRWAFNNATAKAFQRLYEEHWMQPNQQPNLFSQGEGIPDPRPSYVDTIKMRVLGALDRGRTGFQVANELDLLLGDALLGRASASEIRRALQQLHDEGAIGGDRPKAKGLEYYVVERA